jgi:hypothetical protein
MGTKSPALRLAELEPITLHKGRHASFREGHCSMEVVARLAGERHTDHPMCACRVMGEFFRVWNDGLQSDEERVRLLKPFLLRLIGTRSTPAVEQRRGQLALDWFVRTFVPAWLDLVPELAPHAAAIRASQEIVDLNTATAAGMIVSDAYAKASVTRETVRYSAWGPAWDAMHASALMGASCAAALACPEMHAAARGYAAKEAASIAAARNGTPVVLEPTVKALQAIAVNLVERMLSVQPWSFGLQS